MHYRTPFTVVLGTAILGVTAWTYRPAHSHAEDDAASFYCGNHKPVHYAKSATAVQQYKDRFNCSGWKPATIGTVSGQLVAGGNPMGGATLSLHAGDATVLGTTSTNNEGRFAFANVPTTGHYEVRVAFIGYQPARQVIDVSDENIVIVIPDAAIDLR